MSKFHNDNSVNLCVGEQGDELGKEDFEKFFYDVHGYAPFPWQKRLTEQVLSSGFWPAVIDLPTGTGKTAVVDTAIFALAVDPKKYPRRVVFVIDRRIVVDQVHQRALEIRERIQSAASPVLDRVRTRLDNLSDNKEVLGVAALRGGIPIENEWRKNPDQPWVVVSTVDQFGSRLLFRGYGVSKVMQPIEAGLTGNDCLVILDEVHLSVPFAETLKQVQTYACSEKLPRRYAVVEMSATPIDTGAERFTLDEKIDLDQCSELKRRVCAVKRAELVPVSTNQLIPNRVLKIIKSISKRSIGEREPREIQSIGVILNRVQTARDTYNKLSEQHQNVFLLTGRMRPLDRMDALKRISPLVAPDRVSDDTTLTIVVATQAIEVGADFSFDALITECASIDSLRQRFGRLDRRGTHYERSGSYARAWIIGSKSLVNSSKPDAVYGEAAKVTWNELKRRLNGNGLVEIGSTALQGFPEAAVAVRENAPLLLKTYIDSWVQTNPKPLVQPSIDSFLHGIGRTQSPDVSIMWRWDRSSKSLELVPPRQIEHVQVPISAAKAWLAGEKELEIADVAQAHISESKLSDTLREVDSKGWIKWAGSGSDVKHLEIKDIQPGDVLVVDPSKGGLSAGNWNPSGTDTVEDLGDRAQLVYGKKATLRLDTRLPYVDESIPIPVEHDVEKVGTERERISEWLADRREHVSPTEEKWLLNVFERLQKSFGVSSIDLGGSETHHKYFIIEEHNASTKKRIVDSSLLDGSDETSSFTSTGVSLKDHLQGVGKRARQIATRLNLPAEIVEDLRLAGELHDLGKVDLRFQLKLVGGDPTELERYRTNPLAKSLGARFQRDSTYPEYMRHEFASVAMINSSPHALKDASDPDLVLHLVGTHHGLARPLPQLVQDTDSQTLSYESDGMKFTTNSNLTETSLAFDMSDRFWHLIEKYGYHGLAWLEAILRLADHQQSAKEGG